MSLNLPFGVYVSTDDDVDLKYRVADDTARDLLITNQLVKIGVAIYHEVDNKRYWLETYPTTGSTVGVVWTDISAGGGGGSGDMTKVVYDPQTIEADTVDTDNHTAGSVNTPVTIDQRNKILRIAVQETVAGTKNPNLADYGNNFLCLNSATVHITAANFTNFTSADYFFTIVMNDQDGSDTATFSAEDGIPLSAGGTTSGFSKVVGTKDKITVSKDSSGGLHFDIVNYSTGGGGAVDSVFGRTGVVVSANGDYTASQVTNAFDKTADDTDDVPEGVTNEYYTEAKVSANTSVTANTAKVSATGSVTTHSDVSDAGSGEIITTSERDKLDQIDDGDEITASTNQNSSVTDSGKEKYLNNASSYTIATTHPNGWTVNVDVKNELGTETADLIIAAGLTLEDGSMSGATIALGAGQTRNVRFIGGRVKIRG